MIPSTVSQHDRDLLRTLAARVREIAEDPSMPARRARLTAHNDLHADRPIVLCFPEGGWDEILPGSTLECENEQLRSWEWTLKTKVMWWEQFRDDNAIDPFFDLRWRISGANQYGVTIPYERGANRGSFTWAAPCETIADFLAKARPAELRVDRAASAAELELATELFGDLLPARHGGRLWWSSGLTQHVIKYIGLESLLLAPYDQPDDLHRMMEWLNNEHLRFVEWLEAEGLLNPARQDYYSGSGGVAFTDALPQADHAPGSPTRLIDSWGFAESQESVGMSPEMFAEFIFPYEKKVLEKFGLNCYGCCEPNHERIKSLLTIPRLRKLAVSPWADEELMAERLAAHRLIYSRKPNPTQICLVFDEQEIRKDIRKTLEITARHRVPAVEIIMKDTHTVQNEPWRISKWIQFALEEVQKAKE